MTAAAVEPLKRWRWMRYVFSMEVRKIVAYRIDFWIQFVGGAAAQFAVAFFLWRSIFSQNNTATVGRFTFGELMLYYLLVPIVGRAIRGSRMGSMSDEIYQGSLSRYLIYPLSFFQFKFTAHIAHTALFLMQGIAVLGIVGIFAPAMFSSTLSPLTLGMALVATFAGTFLSFVVISTIELIAFWADNVWSLIVILRFATGLLGGSLLPLSLFPDRLVPILKNLPFAFFMNFPVRCLTGDVTGMEWGRSLLLIALWSAGFLVLFRVVWNRGKYRYTGVGI